MPKVDPYYTVHIEAKDKKKLDKISKKLYRKNIPYTWDSDKNIVFEIHDMSKDDILREFQKFNILKFDDKDI